MTKITRVIPVICGPTASGKSAVAIEVAKQLNGEIISADSMQIYRHLDIGTAKVMTLERQNIPHHLIDCCEPNEKYSVARFQKEAMLCIEDIIARGKLPIVCGGTGLYINSLIEGIDFAESEPDNALRQMIEEQIEKTGLDTVYQELLSIDPAAAGRINPNDKKRIVRAIEVFKQTGLPQTQHLEISKLNGPQYLFELFILSHDREKLYTRINQRVDEMFQKGLVDEARWFYKNYPESATAHQAIGYKETIRYLQNEESLEQAVSNIKQATRRYAKRQLTWFRRYNSARWLTNLTMFNATAEIVSICNNL